MNMKYVAILFGACLALSGCVVETGGSNGGSGGSTATGGTGGTAGGGVGGGTAGSSTGGATGGSGGATGGTGGSSCMSCGVFITEGTDTSMLCTGNGPPSSAELYNALGDCTCNGACSTVCTDNVCAGADITTECQACVTDTASGCGAEFNECANDI